MIARILKQLKQQSFFLFGPRGTGKSTWTKTLGLQRLDLLDDATFAEFAGSPRRLEARMDGWQVTAVVIDEIQKLPALLDEVHRLIENRGFRFVLTVSSARKLRQRGVNLLAGRARTVEMHPFTAAELGTAYRLDHALQFGLLPSVWTVPDPATYLRSYVGTFLREEVRQEALVRNIGSFGRFLEAASFSQGAQLSMQAVAADCGLPARTVQSHFDLLEDLLLAIRLPVFARRAQRSLVQHPKFYLFDAGVFRALRPRGPLDSPAEIDGAALETLLLQEILAHNSAADLGYKLHFWRTRGGHEVDFVAYGERGLLAFEVKRSDKLRSADFAGLKAFVQDYPVAKARLVYGGAVRYVVDGVEVVPFVNAVRELGGWLAG